MRLKKTLLLLIVVLMAAGYAYSQMKIGVVNAQEIMQKTKKGIEIQNKMDGLSKQKQNQIQAMQDEIKKLEKDVVSPALNNETREKKSEELQVKRTDLKRFVEDSQRELQRELQKELSDLEREIMPLIENIGKTQGFTIIFDRDRSGLVYYDQAIDVTPEIIKAVDAKFSSK